MFELQPSGFLTQNEIDAAKSVKLDYFNTQGQVKFTWPASYSLARAYLDQLERSNGLDQSKIASARAELASAEKSSGATQSAALARLVSQLESESTGAADAAKVQLLAGTLKQLKYQPDLAGR